MKTKMIPYEKIREKLSDDLGYVLPQETWSYLVRKGFVAEISKGRVSHSDLLRETRDLEAVRLARSPNTPDGPLALTQGTGEGQHYTRLHQEALSLLFAERAAGDEEVIKFRKEVLSDELLRVGGVGGWIEKQRDQDGEPTMWVEVPLTDEQKGKLFEGEEPSIKLIGEVDAKRRFVAYGVPGNAWAEVMLTTSGGILERLRKLSEGLAKQFSWQPAQATLFILVEGFVPLVQNLVDRFQGKPLPAASRLTLEIDPTMPPRILEEQFRAIRARVFSSRYRPLSKKNLQLVAFVLRQRKGRSWPEIMTAWNKKHSEYRYHKDQIKNFKRDARTAKEHLVSPDYVYVR